MTISGREDEIVPNVFPLGMKNSDLVLQDGDGNSAITQLEELSISGSEPNLGPAAINIENSKDVIIGPVTQFHGPVTIYQNVNGTSEIENKATEIGKCTQNGKLVKSESTSSEASYASEKASKHHLLYSKHLKYIGIPIILVIIGLIIFSAIILSQKSEQADSADEVSYPDDTTDDGGSLKPIGRGSFIPRTKWGAHSPLNGTKPLPHPTPFVIISHTATPVCKTFVDCSKRVLSIQNYHVGKLNYPDIGYNFLIGGDANIYVGRGWDVKNIHSSDSIAICFIGNYVYDYLTNDMIASAQSLILKGVEMKKLAENYKVICHNQTYPTESPGAHVYQVVKKWPHFDPSSFMKNSHN